MGMFMDSTGIGRVSIAFRRLRLCKAAEFEIITANNNSNSYAYAA